MSIRTATASVQPRGDSASLGLSTLLWSGCTQKNAKKIEFCVDKVEVHPYSGGMPNKRARDKKRLNLWLNRELYRRVELYSRIKGMTMTEVVVKHLKDITAEIELTKDDYKAIYEEMCEAERTK